MVVEEPVYEFEEIEFCQTHPICVGEEWRMVRNYQSSREKDSMCLFPLTSAGALQSWMYAVGECGLSLTSGVPVMQEMYKAYMRHGKPSKMGDAVFMQSGSRMMSNGMEAKETVVEQSTRFSFYKAFGILPDEQVAMEEYYRGWSINPTVQYVGDIGCIGVSPM